MLGKAPMPGSLRMAMRAVAVRRASWRLARGVDNGPGLCGRARVRIGEGQLHSCPAQAPAAPHFLGPVFGPQGWAARESPRAGTRARRGHGALTNAPVLLGPGRPSATRTASTSGRGSASARTPTGATASAFCSSAAAWGGPGRRAPGARCVSAGGRAGDPGTRDPGGGAGPHRPYCLPAAEEQPQPQSDRAKPQPAVPPRPSADLILNRCSESTKRKLAPAV